MHPVVTEQAESKLLDHLYQLEPEYRKSQLVILHGSQLRLSYRRILRMRESHVSLVDIIQKFQGTAYMCGDGDIVFVLADGAADPAALVHNILHELLPFLDTSRFNTQGVLSIYKLAEHYDAMLDMARAKKMGQLAIDHLNLSIDQQRAETAAKAAYQWNPELFEHARQKRAGRIEKIAAVIEDDATLRQVAREVLRAHYGIMPSADGHAGLELYNTHAPDLVFLDIDIPHIDGLRVLQTIMEGDPQAVVIMVTGHNQLETIQKARQMGARGFVTKPFSAGTLLQHARHALGDGVP